ncbi:MAG: F-type H+-transporting ATPase subunit a [Chloroflexota bacterium]|nr:F-type H+-transporting ATPase subunit a [Chloroflexota bacterium]
MEIHVPIQPAPLFDFVVPGTNLVVYVTNTMVTSWIVMLLLIGFGIAATRGMKLAPSGLQNAAETIIELLLGLAEQVAGSRARSFLPLVATLFLYIWFSNWFGILPGVGSFQGLVHGEEASVLRSPNSDLSLTAAMALIVFAWVQIAGLRANPVEFFVKFLKNPLELVSEFSRPVSLALRLFGNILAGGILVEVMLQIAPIAVPAVFLGLEMFVGLVQALIFAILTLAFLSLATEHGHSESHAETEHAAH